MVVIAMSVHTASQVEAAMREAGAAGFINKEAAVDQLVQMIHEIRASTEATKQRP
jgi:DNA-binding NarL/FixJ family response regulator